MKKRIFLSLLITTIVLGTVGCAATPSRTSSKQLSKKSEVSEASDDKAASVESSGEASSDNKVASVEFSDEASSGNDSLARSNSDLNMGTAALDKSNTFGGADTPSGNVSSNNAILLPTIGEFFSGPSYEDDEEFKDTPDGEHYGFKQDYSDACSVWCAVDNRKCTASTSSYLPKQGKFTYGAEHLIDQDKQTVWSEGVDGIGIGEYISIKQIYDKGRPNNSKIFDFYTICIVNGYACDKTKWQNNGRVAAMDFYFNDRYICTLELEDTLKPQYFDISEFGLNVTADEEADFGFEIKDTYPGDKYEDTVLTGIEFEFWTPNH